MNQAKFEIDTNTPSALIISSEGFISSHLAEQLLEFPIQVEFISLYIIEEIQHLKANQRFKEIKAKSIDSKSLAEYLTNAEYLFHILSSPTNQQQEKIIINQIESSLEVAGKFNLKLEFIIQTHSPKETISSIITKQKLNPKSHEPETRLSRIEALIWKISKENKTNVRVLKILNIYGPRMLIDKTWPLATSLESLHNQSRISMKGEGLDELYPLFITDAISAVVKAMFTEGTKNESLSVLGTQEMTTLNLIYKIRETLLSDTGHLFEIEHLEAPDSQSTSLNKSTLKQELERTKQILGWNTKVEFVQGLSETLYWLKRKPSFRSTKRDNLQKKDKDKNLLSQQLQELNKKISAKSIKVKKRSWLKTTIVTAIVILILPSLIFTATSAKGLFSLKRAIAAFKNAQYSTSQKLAKEAQEQFISANTQLLLTFSLIPNTQITKAVAQDIEEYLEIGKLSSQAIQHAGKSANLTNQIKDIVMAKTNQNISETASRIKTELDALYTKLSHIEALLKNRKLSAKSRVFASIDKQLTQEGETIQNLKSIMEDNRDLVDLLPILMGEQERKTYLVLLQNNAELRPTGGFIGSYVLLTFEKGRLLDFVVEDVYSADGQLKGHIDPPAEIKKYLGEAGWYLRDANWDPDFPTSARQIEWFFEKETGIQVNGTIAINLYVIQEILKELGEIELPDYNEAITADNLFATAENYSELNFFPGSTQKRDFLTKLSNQLILITEEADSQTLAKILVSLYRSLNNGQLLVSLHDTQAQKFFKDLSWDGGLRKVTCTLFSKNKTCLKNYFAIREANLGVNKANYFIERRISLNQDIKQRFMTTKLQIYFKNHSSKNTWPGGAYKNYMRVYTDQDKVLKSVSLNGQRLDDKSVTIKAEHDKLVVGFLVTIPVLKEAKIDLILEEKLQGSQENNLQIATLIQKQPGTEGDPFSYKLSYSTDYEIKTSSPELWIQDHTSEFSHKLVSDLQVSVELKKVQ